jgi:ABC-2 type transport system permease protein
LAGSLIKNHNAQSAVANTVALGLAFLSGSFVPQSLLNANVLAVARFLPTYWYVRASDQIGRLSAFSWETLKPVIFSFLIQLGFAAALICIALVVARQVRSGPARQG